MLCNTLTGLEDHLEFNFYKMAAAEKAAVEKAAAVPVLTETDRKCPQTGGARIQTLDNQDVASCGVACRAESACVGFSIKTTPGVHEGKCMLCNTLTGLEDHLEFNFYKMVAAEKAAAEKAAAEK